MLYVEAAHSVFQFAENLELIQAYMDKGEEFEPYRISGWLVVQPDRCGETLKPLLPEIRNRLLLQSVSLPEAQGQD